MDRQPHAFPLFRSGQPLVPVTLFFILGIVAGSYQWLTNNLSFPLLIVPVFILILRIRKNLRFNFLLICIVFFLLGAILSSQQINPPLPRNHIKILVEHYNNGKKGDPGISIEGVLSGAPEIFPDKTRLHIDAERVFITPLSPFVKGELKGVVPPLKTCPRMILSGKGDEGGFIPSPIKDFGDKVTGKILITVGSPSVRVNYGDRIRFITKLRIPRNFGNPGEFDYAGNLAREGIYVTGHVENERWIAVIGGKEEQPPLSPFDKGEHGLRTSIEQIRDKIRDFIDGSGAENSAVIKALILGEKGEISKAVRDAFAGTGTAHILAISGLHIGIIAFVSYWMILKSLKLSERLMLAFDIRKIAAASSIVPVLLYGAIAGFSVSTQRAVIMVLVFILSVIIDRERNFYNTLAAAAFVILVVSPLSIYDISFQLSFISVLAIIYIVPKFQALWINDGDDFARLLPSHLATKQLQNYLLNPLAVSIAASLGTAPFIAWHFHRVSIIGVLANIIAVPLMGFIAVPLGLISSLASFFYLPFAELLLKFSDIILKVSLWIVDIFSRLPYSSVYTTTPTMLEAVLFYLLIICIVELKRARVFKYGLAVVTLVIMGNYSFWHYHLNYNSNLKVAFISVGQGDSALVEFPYGKRMLIDGGGFYNEDFDVGERIIAPFLWKNKIGKIDYLVLSHPQADHMKGLKFIAEKFAVNEFRWNGEVSNERAFTELIRTLDKNNVQKFIANASTSQLDINGVKVQFLNPPADSRLDTNNKSLIVRLSYKDVGFLFTGDIEAVGEMALLKRNENIHTVILKVPHHGSRTSSTIGFLKAVNPKLAVISLGYSDPFGFPHPEILKRYEELKIPVLRTDINGAVTIETNGADIKTAAFR